MKKYIETVSDDETDIFLEYYVHREYRRDGERPVVTTVRSVLINFGMRSEDPAGAVETGKGFQYLAIRLSPSTILELAKQINEVNAMVPPDNAELDC